MANVPQASRSKTLPPEVLQDEQRILRHWTPVLLRTILIAAAIILVIGLIVMTRQPGAYVARFEAIVHGKVYSNESLVKRFSEALHGDPHAIVTVGLMVLTLVPLARVAFCFLLFLRERDWMFVVFTAYVLSGLVVGVILGRVG
ncbi:MAG TPA: DUF1634 domain-containing protein [Candidatus Binataceae bacterium]|nr:DUF1634 domain-containing protein [Candidatus Binataceae bacterium]